MSTELLASKIVILEEEPNIPAITPLPSAVLLALGTAERGPIADRTLITSFDEYVRFFGGFFVGGQLPIAMYGFFLNGGSFAWVSRTVHFTDLTDPNTSTAVKGTISLPNSGTLATAAQVTGTDVGPFILNAAEHIDLDIGAGSVVSTFNATPGQITDTVTYPISALTAESMGITVDGAAGGAEQTITAVGGETTALQLAALINDQLVGASAIVSGSQVAVTCDVEGTDSGIQVTTAGTLNAILLFPTSKSSGTGNVGNIKQVTGLEVEAIVELAVAGANVVVNGTGTLTFQTVATGVITQIQVAVTSTVDFGCDNAVHNGTDATPQNTLKFDGKTPGAYTDNITIVIANATSGDADEFNVQILVSGVIKEVFANVQMQDGVTPIDPLPNEVVATINDVNSGSNYVAATDLALGVSTLLKRPANITSSAMTGGDNGLTSIADSDYIGNQAGPTGLYCFDVVQTGTLLIVPGLTTSAVQLGMLDYAEQHRAGSIFCVLDCPAGYTAAQMVAWVDSNGILEYSEFGAVYWPRIIISNPSTTVFGTSDTITVPYSGFVTGKYAANDARLGGVYESPAGVGGGWGILRGMLGVEDDPSGSKEHEVLDETKRDLVYPKRINPITKLPNQPWHIDGGRTLKSTSNFPNIGERRGVIFIEQTVKAGLVILKHRFNNRENRMKARRIIRAFLIREMGKGAFRTNDPSTAFFVDVSDALNPLANEFAGIMTIRIGLATNKPAEYIVVLVQQDTRALQEELAAA